jgi:hypothetical protein
MIISIRVNLKKNIFVVFFPLEYAYGIMDICVVLIDTRNYEIAFQPGCGGGKSICQL